MWSGLDGCRSSTLQPSSMAKHAADNYLTEETIIKQFNKVKTVDKKSQLDSFLPSVIYRHNKTLT